MKTTNLFLLISLPIFFVCHFSFGQTWTNYTAADGVEPSGGWNIFKGANGDIWVPTANGVSRFDGTSWETIRAEKAIESVAEDRDGNLWIGIINEGIDVLDGGIWRNYNTSNSFLSGNMPFTIRKDLDGNMWIASWEKDEIVEWDGMGVDRFDGNNWTHFSASDGLGSNDIIDIEVDQAGNIWFACLPSGGHPGGVTKYDGTTWTNYTTDDGLTDNYVYEVCSDNSGNIWVGTERDGVCKFDGVNWTNYSELDGLVHNSVSAIATDRHGHMWFGTRNGGVSHLKGNTWVSYTVDDGLGSNYISQKGIVEDEDGNIWLGTLGTINHDGDVSVFTPQYVGLDEGIISGQDVGLYPNPVENEFTIAYALEHAATVNVVITDIRSGKNHDLGTAYQKAGAQKMHFRDVVSTLQKGIYTIRLTINDKTYVKKLVKI